MPAGSPVPSWLPGRWLAAEGRTRLVALAGAGSRSGDAERQFAGLLQFLHTEAGYDRRRDLLEGTYAGSQVGDRWLPRGYTSSDTRASLATSTDGLAGVLEWYRDALPPETKLCVLGFSLGGVVGLDGATLAMARDRAAWRGKLAAVITLASPVLGTDAEPFLSWAWLGTSDAEGLGDAGDDLVKRWKDPQERARVQRRAEFLRAQGTRVLTLADPDDAVVRPIEAVLPEPGQSEASLLVRAEIGGSARLGHGGLLDEPRVWRRVLEVIGPQTFASEASSQTGGGDVAIEDELAAIKARLRAQGRIP